MQAALRGGKSENYAAAKSGLIAFKAPFVFRRDVRELAATGGETEKDGGAGEKEGGKCGTAGGALLPEGGAALPEGGEPGPAGGE